MATDRRRPDDPNLADEAQSWVGAYVHLPFCHRVCPYCDFAVVAGAEDMRGPYVRAVLSEIEAAEPFPRPLDSIYIGGGTPSLMDPSHIGSIIAALQQRFGVAGDAEVSIEANPEDVDAPAASAWLEAGVNRVSLGAQSFDAAVLASLGRAHEPSQTGVAVEAARNAGVSSVNIDLIFGTAGESVASWRRSVGSALDLGVDHLSAYALTVERGTPLSRAVAAGAPAPDSDDQADKYEVTLDAAHAAGLIHYETSNFATQGHHCRYNLLTWAQGEYAAFGVGANRYRHGERSWNVRRIDRYMERDSAARRSNSERLDEWGVEVERVMLGLRRRAGVVSGEAGRALLESGHGQRLVEAGILAVSASRIIVRRPLMGDAVGRALLDLEPR